MLSFQCIYFKVSTGVAVNHAAEVLGIMISSHTEDFHVHASRTLVTLKHQCHLLCSPQVDSRSRFIILMHCTTSLILFLARSYDTPHSDDILREMDSAINQVLLSISNGTQDPTGSLPAHASVIRNLPCLSGGLGIIYGHGPYSSIHRHNVQLRTVSLLATTLPPMLHRYEALQHHYPLDALSVSLEDNITIKNGKSRLQQFIKSNRQDLMRQLMDNPATRSIAANIQAGSFKSGAASFTGGKWALSLPSATFSHILSARLGLLLLPGMDVRCPCSRGATLTIEPINTTASFHYNECPFNSPHRTNRHTDVVKCFIDYITAVCPTAIITPNPETRIGNNTRYGNILVRIPTNNIFNAYFIDVVIVSGTKPTYLQRLPEPDDNGNYGPTLYTNHMLPIIDGEKEKRRQYQGAAINLVPLGINHNGSIGPNGIRFMDLLENRTNQPPQPENDPPPLPNAIHPARAQLTRKIVNICNFYGAKMRSATLRRLDQVNAGAYNYPFEYEL